MTFENDLKAAAQAFVAADRIRLGGPLTEEEIDAYQRGELSGQAAARVRALLTYGPAAADEESADDALNPADLAHDRAQLLARIAAHSEASRGAEAARDAWPRWFSIAWLSPAALRFAPIAAAVLLAALLVQSRVALRRANDDALAPRVAGPRFELEPALSARGPSAGPAFVLPEDDESIVLAPRLDAELRERFHDFRLAIVDSSGATVWKSPTIRPRTGQPLELTLHRGFLGAGVYRLDAYGLEEHDWQKVASYDLRVEGR